MAFPSAADVRAWASLASRRGVERPRVCEINPSSPPPALLLLSERDLPTRAASEYRAVVYRKPGANATASVPAGLEGRGSIRYVETGRSVLPADAGIPERSCDIVVVDTRDPDARHRQSLLSDLTNVARRVAGPKNLLVLHGAGCSSAGLPTPSNEEQVAAWRKAVSCDARRIRNCAAEGAWCARLKELVDAGAISQPECRETTGGRWCAAAVPTNSLCEREGWLDRPRGWRNGSLLFSPDRPKVSSTVKLRGSHLSKRPVFSYSRDWRYYSAFPCHNSSSHKMIKRRKEAVCMVFKNSMFENWVGGITSHDGVTFTQWPELVIPMEWPSGALNQTMRMTHNMAILRHGGEYILIGGQSRPSRHDKELRGIFMTRGNSWRFGGDKKYIPAKDADNFRFGAYSSRYERRSAYHALLASSKWRSPQHLVGGRHQGCVEKRDGTIMEWIDASVCEFDGRLSLTFFRGEYILYARANPAAHGQRFVQFTKSRDLRTWTPFHMIKLHQYDFPLGEVYFFAVQVNPVHPSSLIALFPLVHRFRGCVAFSFSLDGAEWSSPTSLTKCGVYGDRAQDHPVAGLVPLPSSKTVMLYIQRNVPSVQVDMFTPWQLQMLLKKDFPESRVDWYAIPEDALLELTLLKLQDVNQSSASRDS